MSSIMSGFICHFALFQCFPPANYVNKFYVVKIKLSRSPFAPPSGSSIAATNLQCIYCSYIPDVSRVIIEDTEMQLLHMDSAHTIVALRQLD